MNKATQVREALQGNPDIAIVGVKKNNYLPESMGYWSITFDFYVAPKAGGVYSTKALQALMMSLVPGLEPACKDDFRDGDEYISIGVLYFDEVIGQTVVRRESTLTEPELFSSTGFVDGKRVKEYTEKIQRRTWVRLYPDIRLATIAFQSDDLCTSVPKSEFAK